MTWPPISFVFDTSRASVTSVGLEGLSTYLLLSEELQLPLLVPPLAPFTFVTPPENGASPDSSWSSPSSSQGNIAIFSGASLPLQLMHMQHGAAAAPRRRYPAWGRSTVARRQASRILPWRWERRGSSLPRHCPYLSKPPPRSPPYYGVGTPRREHPLAGRASPAALCHRRPFVSSSQGHRWSCRLMERQPPW